MEKSTEVKDLVIASFEAMKARDIGFWEHHLSEQEGVVTLGTDPSEWWSGRKAILEAITPQIKGLSGTFVGVDPQAYSQGTVGWFADQFKWKLPNGRELPTRLSGVCS